MSTSAGLGKLKAAAKDLSTHWGEAHAVWHDENSQRFEEDFIAPLLARVRKVEMTLAHMAAVLQELRHDCE
jgi:hypothetical protein